MRIWATHEVSFVFENLNPLEVLTEFFQFLLPLFNDSINLVDRHQRQGYSWIRMKAYDLKSRDIQSESQDNLPTKRTDIKRSKIDFGIFKRQTQLDVDVSLIVSRLWNCRDLWTRESNGRKEEMEGKTRRIKKVAKDKESLSFTRHFPLTAFDWKRRSPSLEEPGFPSWLRAAASSQLNSCNESIWEGELKAGKSLSKAYVSCFNVKDKSTQALLQDHKMKSMTKSTFV